MAKEIKVALLFIVASVLFFFGFNYLKGRGVLSSNQYYVSTYSHIGGLVGGNQVLLNGLSIGLIETSDLRNDGSGLIDVGYSIRGGVQIPKGTVAQIFANGLMGDMAMQLLVPSKVIGFYASGDTIQGEMDAGLMAMATEQLLPVADDAGKVIQKVDTLMASINALMATGNIQSSVETTERMLKSLEKTAAGIDRIIADRNAQLGNILSDFEQISASIANNTENINRMISNATKLTDDVAALDVNALFGDVEKTLDQANNALLEVNGIIADINAGEGSVGALLKNDTLYQNLEDASKNLDDLMIDLKENPSRYVHFSVFNNTARIERRAAKKAEKEARKEAKRAGEE